MSEYFKNPIIATAAGALIAAFVVYQVKARTKGILDAQ
jgi:hypothetical protein